MEITFPSFGPTPTIVHRPFGGHVIEPGAPDVCEQDCLLTTIPKELLHSLICPVILQTCRAFYLAFAYLFTWADGSLFKYASPCPSSPILPTPS